jgi:CheY-like chemotaxis protein
MKTSPTLKILLIEDNPADARMVDVLLADGHCPSYQLTHKERLSEAVDTLSREVFDIALLDLNLPDGSGMDVFLTLHNLNPELPIVILTGQDDHDLGKSMVKAGAQSYLTKGDSSPELFYRSLQHSIERQHLHSRLELKHTESEKAQAQFRSLIEGNESIPIRR